MAKNYYAYSTLANDQNYTVYENGGGDVPLKKGSVIIKGGTGVADKRLITPLGVATQITEAEYELLKENTVFQQHEKNGFITVKQSNIDAEKVAADLSLNDDSTPLTESDFKEGKAPKTGKKSK